ncbi:hypothetical protein HJC23_000625 [Cyclotella cryptica]|uniref:Orc1-like AAA ATPase domain-containing protein n=1 Tax=Cyclotella cryptica TaxID=29204 RepID=A0ABD3Q6W1_9STRA|eukprot:CCRYP_008015-RA/>CCRYP_008015-RA protein AED:0.02 eAED:0.02 QI:193/1/1/1/1/1/4/133/1303
MTCSSASLITVASETKHGMANQDYTSCVEPRVKDEGKGTSPLHFPTCVAAPSAVEGGETSTHDAKTRPKIYGRSIDLKRLQTIYEAVSMGHQQAGVSSCDSGPACAMVSDSCVVFVTGLAGVGKSALVHEFINANQLHSNRIERRRRLSDESWRKNKLPFMHVSIRFCDAGDSDTACGSSQLGHQLSELHDSLEAIALKISRQVSIQTNNFTRAESRRRDDDSTSSDEDSITEFDETSQEEAPGTQLELNEILSINKPKSKESLCDLLKFIGKYVTQPFVMFFDDLQNVEAGSCDVLSFLLRSSLSNVMIICASRAFGSTQDHPMQNLTRSLDERQGRLVETLTVHPLPLEVITKFTADCLQKDPHEAAIVAKTVYINTMGVISYVIQALTEAVLENVLHYDTSVGDWRWELNKVYVLTDYVSSDGSIFESLKLRLNHLPTDVRLMMILMSCLSHDTTFRAPLLVDVMEIGGNPLDEKTIENYVQLALNEGFFAETCPSSNHTVQFAHPVIRKACQVFITDQERHSIFLRVFTCRFDKWNRERPHKKWYKKEMSFLVEFFDLLDLSSGCRRAGRNRRNKGQLSKSMGPSISVISKEDGKDVRLSDCRDEIAPLQNVRKKSGDRNRRGTEVMLSKSMSHMDISDIQDLESSLADDAEKSLLYTSKPKKTSPRSMVELLSDKITRHGGRPLNTTKQILDYLFFPHITEPKSWLLKHGSVFVGTSPGTMLDIGNERELMFFTHGFIVADIALKDIFRLYFALSDEEFLTAAALIDYVRTKLNTKNIDSGLEEEIVYECLCHLTVPQPKNLVAALFEKLDPNKFQESLEGFITRSAYSSMCMQDSDRATKVEKAKLFSSIARVDSLDVSHVNDPRSVEIYNSCLADASFSVTPFNEEDETIHFVCATNKDRDSWLSKFQQHVIEAWENSSDVEMLKKQAKLGWQHLVVRSSPTTFVILDDHSGLEKFLDKNRVDLNTLDDYNGYSALHYATILGHTRCVDVLLRKGAAAKLQDKNGLSPMIHAVALGHDDAANLIEAHGSKRQDAVKSVEEDEEIRKAAIKATSESLRSLELSDNTIMDYSCVSGSLPTLNRHRKSDSCSHLTPKCIRNSQHEQTTQSILRGAGSQSAPTILRATSLEDFKHCSISARRVYWADVAGKPESLRSIVTYELSENDNSDDDSIDITDTSTSQETMQSEDEADDDTGDISKADYEKLTNLSLSPILPQRRSSRNKMTAEIGRNLLGRPTPSILSTNSNESEDLFLGSTRKHPSPSFGFDIDPESLIPTRTKVGKAPVGTKRFTGDTGGTF